MRTIRNFNWFAVLAALAFTISIVGCTPGGVKDVDIDPVSTGEIVGFAYLMTKHELEEEDRQTIEKAYEIFADVARMTVTEDTTDLKGLLFNLIDEKMPEDDDRDIQRKVAVKIIINRYWTRVDVKYNISDLIPADQLSIIQQVYIGIERGLGREADIEIPAKEVVKDDVAAEVAEEAAAE